MDGSPKVVMSLTHDDCKLIVKSLCATPALSEEFRAAYKLADRIDEIVAAAVAAAEDEAEEARRQEYERAARAANHTLTKTQAETLAAVRAGKGPNWSIDRYGYWRHAKSMGGARKRMVALLTEEGLLNAKRELTGNGLGRLQVYEQRNGAIRGIS